MNLNDLDPESPEFEAALEAAQAEEDAATGNTEGVTTDAPGTDDEAAPAADATHQAAPQDDPEKLDTAPAAGVASKDGKHVLPFAVVQSARAERRAERDARLAAEAERDALRQQLEDLRAGKQPTVSADDELEAEIAEAAADYPLLGKLYEHNKALRAEVQAAIGKRSDAPADKADKADPDSDPLQDDIDAVPALAEWQATDAEKFEAAKLIDAALLRSPKWQSKPQVERFQEVARKVAEQFDIQINEPAPQGRTTPNKADPKAVIAGAARAAPNTLSDFKTGTPDNNVGRLDKLPPQRAMARMTQMTDAEIDEHLARFG